MAVLRVIAFLFASASALALASCSSLSIKDERDPQANLAGYSTYAWEEPPQAGQAEPSNDMLDRKIKSAADQELSQIGMTKVEKGADLNFVYWADVSEHLTRSNGGMSVGVGIPTPGPVSVGVGTSTAGRTYTQREGKLTLDAVDPSSGKTVWRGVATGTVDEEGRNDARIKDAIAQLLSKFEEERKAATPQS